MYHMMLSTFIRYSVKTFSTHFIRYSLKGQWQPKFLFLISIIRTNEILNFEFLGV